MVNSLLIKCLMAIKNGYYYNKEFVKIFFNRKVILLLKFLYKQGLIQDFWFEKTPQQSIIVLLKDYSQIYSIFKIMSKRSKPIFFSFKEICKLYEKKIIYVFLTSFGYLTSFECKELKTGGILFFYAK